MILPTPCTAGLRWHLRRCHDEGEPRLHVRVDARGTVVLRPVGGEEPSETERARILGVLERHALEPLEVPAEATHVRDWVIVVDGPPPLPVRTGRRGADGYRTREAAEARLAAVVTWCQRRGRVVPPMRVEARMDRTFER